MEFSTWLLYATVAIVNIASPGPAILLAISNSVAYGLRRVVFSSLGNICGGALISSLTMAGLGAVLKTSSLLFGILKLVGAAYLIYLGIRQWRSRTSLFARHDAAAPAARNNRQLFMQGFLLALTNPKAILFFTALFPQFLSTKHDLLPQYAIMTGTFMVLSFCSLMSYALLARSAGAWLSGERNTGLFNRFAGGTFMLLGLGMLRLKNTAA
ncbi:MAG TPA: LysE family translocator [Paucimonas sp.]|nr:LysE family translocator [Paucimonas sp.]